MSFGSGGEGGGKVEGEESFRQWMDMRMSMTEKPYAVYRCTTVCGEMPRRRE
jgi:hypothetical protein